MKKMVVLVLLLVLSFAMIGCKEDKSVVDDEVAKNELLSTESFEVDEVQSYEYMHNEYVYIYRHIVGYTDKRTLNPFIH